MSKISTPATYNEPTIMWKMQRPDGSRAQAVIDPMNGRPRVVWFVNGGALGAHYCPDWSAALQYVERLQAQYWSAGWRLSEDQRA